MLCRLSRFCFISLLEIYLRIVFLHSFQAYFLFPFQALLLLNHLTKSNANIQKIVAFENAFERLLDIVDKEEGIDGGKFLNDIVQCNAGLIFYKKKVFYSHMLDNLWYLTVGFVNLGILDMVTGYLDL